MAIRPQSAEIHYNFGIALWEMGEGARAVAGFRRTLELDAGHGLAHCALGLARRCYAWAAPMEIWNFAAPGA